MVGTLPRSKQGANQSSSRLTSFDYPCSCSRAAVGIIWYSKTVSFVQILNQLVLLLVRLASSTQLVVNGCCNIPKNLTVWAWAAQIGVLPISHSLVPSAKIDAISSMAVGPTSMVPWQWKNRVWVCPGILPCLNHPLSVYAKLCRMSIQKITTTMGHFQPVTKWWCQGFVTTQVQEGSKCRLPTSPVCHIRFQCSWPQICQGYVCWCLFQQCFPSGVMYLSQQWLQSMLLGLWGLVLAL